MPVLPKPDYCRPCPLYNASEYGPGMGFSSLEGYGDSGLLVCADSLGQREEEDGLPLRPWGASGAVFRRALDELGIDAQGLTITNLIRCRPPNNELWGQPWTFAAVDHCRTFLSGAIGQRQPTLLLALGDAPLHELASENIGTVSEMRGFVLPSRYGMPLISTYHPSYIARGAWNLYGAFKQDVGRAALWARSGVPAPMETDYVLHPSLDDVHRFLDDVLAHPEWPISYDVETAFMLGEKEPEDWKLKRLVQIQFSVRPGHAIVLPWDGGGFSKAAKLLLSTPNPKWGWNSARSDDILLRANGVALHGELHDLMLAWAHCLHRDTRVELWDGPPTLLRKIVEGKVPVVLKGMDLKTGEVIPVKVVDWHVHENTKGWVQIKVDGARQPIWCTPDHQIFTALGWKEAKDTTVADSVALPKRTSFDVIQGTIFGDGYVNRAGRLSFHHCKDQIEWCRAKATGAGMYFVEVADRVTASLKLTKALRTEFYADNGQKIFSPPSPAALAVWYGDDGTYRFQPTSRLGTPGISVYNVANFEEAVDWFREVFGNANVSVRARRSTVNGGAIFVISGARMQFFEMIAPWLHPSMERKLPVELRGRYNGWMDAPTDTLYGPVISVVGKPRSSTKEYCVTVDHPDQAFFTRGGLVHNCQPDFTARGDDRDGDEKGIPSKLMGLQSALSFYHPEVGPWKHLGSSNLQLYGAYDADYTGRCGAGIFDNLSRLGLMAGYREHKYELRFALDDIGEYGLPVDRERQAALRVYTLGELHRIQTDLHTQVPSEILSLHPKTGYKALHSKLALVDAATDQESWPKASLRELAASYDPSEPPLVMAAGHVGYLKQRDFNTGLATADTIVLADGTTDQIGAEVIERRWCIERLYNPHASSPNTKAYIRYKGYPMPVNYNTGQDTTGKTELLKLAKETGDPVLKLTYDWRDLAKTGLDYTTGRWVPGEDGRVHPTFRCGTTASGQTTCTEPNAQQYPEHSGIAKRAKEAIRAEPGHVFVKMDARGAHARAIGWLANDPVYYKLADFDVHSFITAHYLHLHDAPYLLEMEDDELRAALEAVKAEHKHTRNYKVKRVVHGRQFNMGVRKLYQLHGADFDPPAEKVIEEVGPERWYSWDREKQIEQVNKRGRREAQRLFNLFDQLFPKTFVLYLNWIREQIHHVTPNRLVSAFGHHRMNWNFDMEQAAAFLPSNSFHCEIQSALVRLRKSGALRRYGGCVFAHDSLWMHCPERLVDDCITEVKPEFERPSTILVDSPLGPFQCTYDVEVGPDLAHMESL